MKVVRAMLMQLSMLSVIVTPAFGLKPPLRVCTVSTCGRNGGQAFFDALQTLSAGSELEARSSGCMSRCRGVVVAGGHLSGEA